MKRLLLSLMLLVASFATFAHDFEVDGIYYDILSDSTCEVTYEGFSYGADYVGHVVIPSQVSRRVGSVYSVTGIGGNAFRSCHGLTSITIPQSVTSIEARAFQDCSKLTKVTLPSGISVIENNVFMNCSSLTDINLPNSVTSIRHEAFRGCSALANINIPSSVGGIGDFAFYYSGITNFVIPKGVKGIGTRAFEGCSNLTRVEFNAKRCSGVEPYLFCSLFDGCENFKELIIGDEVEVIPAYVFSGCEALKSVTIGNNVTSIGEHAFSHCHKLTSLTLPNSVVSIEDFAFRTCNSLTCITLGNSLTSIGAYAFQNCALTSITLPNSVTSIGEWCFAGCSHLMNVTIGNGMKRVANKAFYNCSGLLSAVIGKRVTNIGDAFNGCTKLSSVMVNAEVPPFCATDAFKDVNMNECHLYVPYGKVTSYLYADVWREFLAIDEMEEEINAQSVVLNSTSATLEVDDTYQLEATVSPSNAEDKSLTWISSNPEVATVSDDGLVTAVAIGTAEIVCRANGGACNDAVCEITVRRKRAEVRLSSAGYATFYGSESAYSLPDELSAQVVIAYSKNKLTYKTIAGGTSNNIIPKGTAVILVGDSRAAGTYTLTPVENTDTYTGRNLLHGSDEATTTTASGENYYYKLTYGEGAESDIFGWYWGAANGAAFQIDGHKAWLALPKSLVTRSGFALDEETAIEEVMTEEDEVYYDLQGRRIDAPTASGIYIVNGKKVMIKK